MWKKNEKKKRFEYSEFFVNCCCSLLSFARDLKSVVYVIFVCYLSFGAFDVPYFHSSELFALLQVAERERWNGK